MNKLSQISRGASVYIRQLPSGIMRSHFIRLGLVEGIIVTCAERLPGGTLVLEYNRQEIALSGDLADQISVSHG